VTKRIVVLPLLAVLLAGCGLGESDQGPDTTPGTAGPQLSGTVTVLAAASLTGTFDALATKFEQANPSVTVTVSYGGSDSLAAQINSGAPVDVFAAASEKTMALVTDAGNAAADPVSIATNQLEIAVPPGNPGGITGLSDFVDKDLAIVLCAAEVPCGAAAVKVFDAAKVTPSVDDYEQNVTSVLTKIELGEGDAGLVYQTDVQAAGSAVTGIEFPESADAITDYPIVLVKNAPTPDAAQAFIDFVTGAVGRSALEAAGFGAP
jgi:molybdate transport system substrate-binding protein